MINWIWICMAAIGIIYAMFSGNMEAVNEAIFTSAAQAVTLAIGLISILVFWLGMMRIAEEAGILRGLARLFRPIVTRIFPEIPKDHPALGYILSNLTANMFGLGNAATPLGIKAMEEMKKLNNNSDTASRSMITFLILNTTGLTLIPTTVIGIRMQYESASPTQIVGVTLLVTAIGTIAGLIIDRIFYYKSTWRKS
ncbi:nucleoside recognition domain-containing protein [Oceanobacillus sojae]|uniref:nucleoside recognition domain-containing protein n=1 Tax=Oceanobacillus sojae TaxID=582851 RepID=UPI0009884D97|nr:nucleoside recognition domain-containing protein [Oceanobacillus sojae]MCT1903265.1 spore maturation protein [Oceanobacillus sojae]